jgi:GntR family transcriptional repressor for pyruvate dehydrogenase complex
MGIEKKTYETLAESIEGMIEAGDLKGGDRLPPERKLAEQFDVSRNTVREAIRILSEKKILISRIGSGTYVAESALSILAHSINETLLAQKNRLKDIFELRKILEPQIAALAAKRIKPGTLGELRDAVACQEKELAEGRDGRAADERFHRLMVEAAGNKVLSHVYTKLSCILSESRSDALQSPERHKRSLSLHKDIIDALVQGDEALAARKMKRHMLDVEKTLSLLDRRFQKNHIKEK